MSSVADRSKTATSGRPQLEETMTLCTIDQSVLAAQKAGTDWQMLRGIHSHRQFMRVFRRAASRAAH
jgi:hypothetical protein